MANLKISELDAAAALDGDELLAGVQDAGNVAVTPAQLSTYLSGSFAATSHTHTASGITDFSEAVDDRVGALVAAGSGISVSYNDGAGTLTIAASGLAATSHAHTAADVSDFAEAVDDRVGALLVAGTNVTLTYSDVGNTLTVAASGGSGTVTTTGSPASGNLAKFSGSTSVTSGDLTGDVTTSGTLAATIANDAVSYAKMQNVSAASKLLGRGSASGSGDPEEITLGTGLSMSGTTLSASSGAAVVTPSYASTLTVDLSTVRDGGSVRVALTGNIIIQLSNGTDGQKFTLELTQDATGSRTVSLSGTYFRFGTDITSFTATTTASKMDRVGCVYNTTNTKADVVAVVKGF